MMGLNIRKFVVGVLALGVLAGVFLLYMHFSRTPPIIIEVAKPASKSADVNETDAPEAIGKFGDIGIGTVRKTEFQHRDGTGRMDRKVGFEQLLHEQGDQWEVTKPYMDLFFPEASCQVTADRGKVQIDTTLRQPTLTNARFMGNVVLHITPRDPNNPWESFIHLDDVGFLAEKSLFSSEGAVRFLSRTVRLTGTGMELIYDMPRSRLERFRVFDLGSLRFRSSDLEALTKTRGAGSQNGGDSTRAAGADPNATPSVVRIAAQPEPPADPNVPPADVYQCVFRGNVRLDSPDGVAIARDVLSINNIQWSGPSRPMPSAPQAGDPNRSESGAEPAPKALNTATSPHVALSAIPEELYDVTITCDGGADITLINGPQRLAETAAADAPEHAPAETAPQDGPSPEDQYLLARRIDYDFSTSDATMLGPFATRFLVDPNVLGDKGVGKPMPALVTAQGAARFLAAARQIILEGGVTATLQRFDPNTNDEVRLTAPRFTLDLIRDPNTADDVKIKLRGFVADGGPALSDVNGPAGAPVATLHVTRQAAGEELGRVTLDARELRYDTNPDQLTALGPGVIWLRNAVAVQSKSDPNVILKPCYASLANFDGLAYLPASNLIVADGDARQLVLDYFPLVDGKYLWTRVVAGHVEAMLTRAAEGRMDLDSLVASQGIEYDSEAEQRNFIGSEMVYDRGKSLITVRGDDVRPCYLNGALVDGIVVNLKTGDIQARPMPSIFGVRGQPRQGKP